MHAQEHTLQIQLHKFEWTIMHSRKYAPYRLTYIQCIHEGAQSIAWMFANRYTHMPSWIFSSFEEKEEGVVMAKEQVKQKETERKSPDSNTVWALGSSNKLTLGHHGDTTNRMKHSGGWPSYCLLCFCPNWLLMGFLAQQYRLCHSNAVWQFTGQTEPGSRSHIPWAGFSQLPHLSWQLFFSEKQYPLRKKREAESFCK